MRELLNTLFLALDEVAKIGCNKSIRIIENAIKQAQTIEKEHDRSTDKEQSGN